MSDRNDWNRKVIAEFRANEGIVKGPFGDRTLLLLHTTGAKTGQERVNPLVYSKDGDRYVVMASKGGAPENPDWFYNLVANPQVEIEVGTEQFKARASTAVEPEYSRLFDDVIAQYPQFAEYQEKTERIIPIVLIERGE